MKKKKKQTIQFSILLVIGVSLHAEPMFPTNKNLEFPNIDF